MEFDQQLNKIYPAEDIPGQRDRIQNLSRNFKHHFKYNPGLFASVPGRAEIGGNHTDHNHGNVLAAAINLDSVAVANKTDDNITTVYSEGYSNPFRVHLHQLDPIPSEFETFQSLIRGIAARFKQLGYQIGGFNAAITSQVLIGSGLSSSASVEVLVGTILNHLYNSGNIQPETLAAIGQYAENVYFNKPCGLMDQLACAVGGFISIDFKSTQNPLIREVKFNLSDVGYKLVVLNTGASHSDLTDEYATIPVEMQQIAGHFKQEVCREISMSDLIENIPNLREKFSDRSILRAMHFINDSERVPRQVSALESGAFQHFLDLVSESGDSSFKWLQNVHSTKDPAEQGISIALALTEHFMKNRDKPAAWRIQGGGFAGTIQVFLPDEYTRDYSSFVNNVFGENAALVLTVRDAGACSVQLS